MAEVPSPSDATLETRADAGTGPDATVSFWLAQETLAENELKDWRKRGRKVIKRYRDERPSSQMRTGAKFNILWANIQVMKPVLYARTPKPDIAPRWIDTEEPVVRMAAQILERSLTYICDRYDIDSVMKAAVEDRLLPGAGFARVRYEPTFGDAVEDPDDPETTYRPVEDEKVHWEYAHWQDVAWAPSRIWEECQWVRFRSYMTRDKLVERFGPKIGKAVPLDYTPKGMEKSDLPPDVFKKATVHEYWDKSKRQVVWIAPSYKDGPLDTKDDPLELDGFFPCPKPLFATTTTDKLIPVPDFAQYQDQADELDTLAMRIDKLTRALKVAGVYAASEKAALVQLLQDNTDNTLIPVEDWAVFAQQKGGLEGTILWLPIDTIAKVLVGLYDAFDRQKEQLYEISGLSDIMRGATDPKETLGAQQLKSQYGTIRTQDSQKDVGRFARDLFRLAGQVISQHLDPKTVSAITGLPELPQPPQMPSLPPQVGGMPGSGAPQPTGPQPQVAPGPMQAPLPAAAGAQPGAGAVPSSPPGATPPVPSPEMAQYQQQVEAFQAYQKEVAEKTQEFQAACALLREDAMRTFRLDIEADSTIAPDEQAEKQGRVEFVTAFGQLLTSSAPLVQAMPQQGGALVSEVIKFLTHGFRAGRPLEETIDKFADALDKLPPPPPHVDPALAKVEAQAKSDQLRLASESQIAAARLQQEDAHGKQRLAIDAEHGQMRLGLEHEKAQAEAALKAESAKNDLTLGLAKVQAQKEVDTHRANLEHQRALADMTAKDLLERQKFDKQHALDRDKASAKASLDQSNAAATQEASA